MSTSSSLSIDKRRRTYVRMIGQIHDALIRALTEEQESRGLTQTGMAEALGASKSFISRKMSGTSNMTLETLADLAFALDRIVKVDLVSRSPNTSSNYFEMKAGNATPTKGASQTIKGPMFEAAGAN